MINTIQPFVNLANANLQATSRFFHSPDLARITRDNTDKFDQVAQESVTRITRSDALQQWSRELIQNYSRFTNECTQSVFAMMTQAPNILAHQAQDFSRQIEKGVSAGFRSVERSAENVGEEVEEGMQEEGQGKGKRTGRQHAA